MRPPHHGGLFHPMLSAQGQGESLTLLTVDDRRTDLE